MMTWVVASLAVRVLDVVREGRKPTDTPLGCAFSCAVPSRPPCTAAAGPAAARARNTSISRMFEIPVTGAAERRSPEPIGLDLVRERRGINQRLIQRQIIRHHVRQVRKLDIPVHVRPRGRPLRVRGRVVPEIPGLQRPERRHGGGLLDHLPPRRPRRSRRPANPPQAVPAMLRRVNASPLPVQTSRTKMFRFALYCARCAAPGPLKYASRRASAAARLAVVAKPNSRVPVPPMPCIGVARSHVRSRPSDPMSLCLAHYAASSIVYMVGARPATSSRPCENWPVHSCRWRSCTPSRKDPTSVAGAKMICV